MQLPTALLWYPILWRLQCGKERDQSYAYFMAFAYMLGVAFQHAAQVFSGAGIDSPLTTTLYLTLVPGMASWMAVVLAYTRRHVPARLGGK
jgi:hypothetical protein